MKQITTTLFGILIFALTWSAGCESRLEKPPPSPTPPKTTEPPAEAKKVLLGPNVFLEVIGKQRRVLVSGAICQREAQLELFMCRKGTKDHEAVVHAEVDGRDIHTGLIAARATPGSPVRYEPFRAPRGTTIFVRVQFSDAGKLKTVDAREWVKNTKTGKPLDMDWVFAGSKLLEDPLDKNKRPTYLANDGELICVSNFEEAMLDLPVNSSKDNAELSFTTFTERIPELGTPVVVVLEPQLRP